MAGVVAASGEDHVGSGTTDNLVGAVAAEDCEAAVRFGAAVEDQAFVGAERIGVDVEAASRRNIAIGHGQIIGEALGPDFAAIGGIVGRQERDHLDPGQRRIRKRQPAAAGAAIIAP